MISKILSLNNFWKIFLNKYFLFFNIFSIFFKSENSIFLKIEYILELSQWLYSHEYQLIDCIDLCEWAIDLLMFNIKQTVITARPLSASTVFSTAVNSTIKPTAGKINLYL